MAQGQRQNLTAKAVSAVAAGTKATWTFDRSFLVSRLKIARADGVADPTGLRIKIRAEGEEFYSGLDLPIGAVAIRTDDANGSTATYSPYVLAFDTPISVSKDYPLEITLTSTTTNSYLVITEGPSKTVAG
jgi:hypothetical protein